ncbi:oxygen-independent coproporphyrinogen III oxidase [Methylonatrum kenyense]|uniref:oxygen-independent coproporphyrinogen III oxidase n=1 Tax=Methylonatrum kenyense TaxID=455253 RepID=UPI0020BD5F1A|nr:oxygen-independent coproporphyrinogen III oxidase [Methylonatrum kenyense]MCK8515617.1 oxygen-independent coproporphyrinogen III oxidase [Methylonatrum kenyense]
MMPALPFDAALYRKYDMPGPRYTSYPTAPHFRPDFDEAAYREEARASNERLIPRPLSVYVHIPFCHSLCYYCACSKIITRRPEKAGIYLDYLERELALQGALFDTDRLVTQLHLGGGTPTYLDDRQLRRLMHAIGHHFPIAPDRAREFSVELDPRALGPETVSVLRDLGMNRVSLGVQDVDPVVQRAINRIQPEEQVEATIHQARDAGFRSINLDLIYGLPHQTLAGFDATLDAVLRWRPERLSVYNYAHLPSRVKAQKLIREGDLPSPGEKLEILQHTVERLTGAGYRFIGMDHFALPEDGLSRAMEDGSLQRNFQGYSTHADCDLVALGVTGIGMVGDAYSQNHAHLNAYYRALDAGRLPVARGYRLSADDLLRRAVIEAIMCRSNIVFEPFEVEFEIDFRYYFRDELSMLEPMERDGLLRQHADRLEILPTGRLLLRNIAMIFDAYLGREQVVVQYSRTV